MPENNIPELAGIFGGDRFRFVASRSDGMYSSRWMAWHRKSDFYVAPDLGGSIKVSLHEKEGGFRVAFDKSFAISAGIDPKERTIAIWPTPDIDVGAAHVLSILLPAANFNKPKPASTRAKRVTEFAVGNDKEAAEIGIFYSRGLSHEILARNT